uniref:VWFA domain-containing protein n=1 Tax=Cannabis sativa TaxID=3483 RepID=A0A803NYJ8_CANSA
MAATSNSSSSLSSSRSLNNPFLDDHDQYHQNIRRVLPTRSSENYSKIGDNYNSLEEVAEALQQAGLESSNLIVGIDFTKSNEWTGARCFGRKNLHFLGQDLNPYEQAISIIGRTLSTFDEDNLIPCYGFGDSSTHDKDVFSFFPEDKPCRGFEELLSRYRELVPRINLSGPTSFAPIIENAISIVDSKGGQYHVLVIIADGQVTRSVDTGKDKFSLQEQKTVDAIVKASEYPLSIILVGVGDGPWDLMQKFDDFIPSRAFDNCQFVNFTKIMVKDIPISYKETEFALEALMEIPSQYKATMELQLLGRSRGRGSSEPRRVPLAPPIRRVPLAPPINYNIPAPSSSPNNEFMMRSSSMNMKQQQRATAFQFSRSSSAIFSQYNMGSHPLCVVCNNHLVFDYEEDLVYCPACRARMYK